MDIAQLANLTVAELTQQYRDGVTDPVQIMEVTLDQIDQVNDKINAIYDVQRDTAMAAAKESAARYRMGAHVGPFDGVPVSIKDSVHAVGMTWHHGARLHGEGVRGIHDAPPTERLKDAKAIIFGKGTMPDFGLSGSGVSSYHGIVRNPWGLEWNTGGSSAGAGASIAAGIGMMSVGSDIAGSVRLPASHCGLASLKPTQGMIPHSPASDVRSAGPITRHAADLEPSLRMLGGLHNADRFSLPVIEPNQGYEHAKVLIYDSFGFGPEVESVVRQILRNAADALSGLVASLQDGQFSYDFDAYLPMDDSFKLRGWREYTGASTALRHETPSILYDWMVEAGTWTGGRIAEMEAGLARGVTQTNHLFADADFLLTPVMPVVNFPASELGPDPVMPLRHCTFTAPFNQSGHPAVSILGGFDARGLPIGVQLVGKRCDDVRLCRLATALEQKLRTQPLDWPIQPRS